jgi:hypothetical protein
MRRTIIRLLVLAALGGELFYWLRSRETAGPTTAVRTAPAPTPAAASPPRRSPAPLAFAPTSQRVRQGAGGPASRPENAAPAEGALALPPGDAELLPQPKGAVVREVRRLPDGGYWVELTWERAPVAEVAEAYRSGLSEKGWRVLTPDTARQFARSFARRGLTTEVEAEEVIVGQGHRRAAAVLLVPAADGRSTRIEVSLLAPGPRRP